jgi:hypothetical protein
MSLRTAEHSDLDSRIKDIEVRLGLIAQPGAIRILLDLLPKRSEDSMLHYVVYRLLERLSALKHRNKVILSGLGILGRLFQSYTCHCGSPGTNREQRIIQKLLRRILDLGATTVDTRIMFQSAVTLAGTLDGDILEMIRGGIRSRWPDHFSLEKRAALKFCEENTRGLPTSGFTFMVCLCRCRRLDCFKASPPRFGFGSSDTRLRKHKLFSPFVCRHAHYFILRSEKTVDWNCGVMANPLPGLLQNPTFRNLGGFISPWSITLSKVHTLI